MTNNPPQFTARADYWSCGKVRKKLFEKALAFGLWV